MSSPQRLPAPEAEVSSRLRGNFAGYRQFSLSDASDTQCRHPWIADTPRLARLQTESVRRWAAWIRASVFSGLGFFRTCECLFHHDEVAPRDLLRHETWQAIPVTSFVISAVLHSRSCHHPVRQHARKLVTINVLELRSAKCFVTLESQRDDHEDTLRRTRASHVFEMDQ